MKCPHFQFENREESKFCGECGGSLVEKPLSSLKPKPKKLSIIEPTSFRDGRHQVKKFLGEGDKKTYKVFKGIHEEIQL